jgi:hypothetical protein
MSAALVWVAGAFLPSSSRAQFPQPWQPPTVAQKALKINIGFNGPADQFPYQETFYRATDAYYRSIGRSFLSLPASIPAGPGQLPFPSPSHGIDSGGHGPFGPSAMPGPRHCHTYISWDIALQSPGSGDPTIEGTRSWFENWLNAAQGNCDEALITFKYISGISTGTGFPTAADYESAFEAFMNVDWRYTGWTGSFAFTAWNEPNNGAPSGDGLKTAVDPQLAADYYLAIRKHCVPIRCTVAAGDFGSNGTLGKGFVQNCTDDAAPLCSTATYMDEYKHYLVNDAPAYGLGRGTSFRPEVFAYHAWDDVNDYINQTANCNAVDDQNCSTWVILNSLSDPTWKQVRIWDTEAGAGQDGHTNPDPVTQACTASFLLQLTATASTRIERIYYTRAYNSSGQVGSLFLGDGTEKPAFTVLADRNVAYTPPAGSTCP